MNQETLNTDQTDTTEWPNNIPSVAMDTLPLNDQWSKDLKKACSGDITPADLAKRILDKPLEYTPIEVWISANYINALAVIGLNSTCESMIDRLEKIKKEGAKK
jgi:hypothetical protein